MKILFLTSFTGVTYLTDVPLDLIDLQAAILRSSPSVVLQIGYIQDLDEPSAKARSIGV